ncbi:MAG: S8 family serine peptidase [Anaerolineae bacterium]
MSEMQIPREIKPVEPPAAQLDAPQVPFLVEVDQFVRAHQARNLFKVTGEGLCAAVLDTGLNTEHVDFAGRIAAVRNFTTDHGGDPDDASDGNGHGTNVAGIVLADGDHVGMAPGARLAALKVLTDSGGGSFQWVIQALDWVLDNREAHDISAVCMSLGDGGNYVDDEPFAGDALEQRIEALRRARVAVVVAAGNDYFDHGSKQGMGYPAIIRHTVSVGAVYDADEGGFRYGGGAQAFSTRAGQITPFSQRLHQSVNRATRTEIFAPGAPVTSAGMNGPHGESIQHGTSQATPVTVGILLLMQEFYRRYAGELPTIQDLITWLRRGGVPIQDGDDEDDNVLHTNLTFLRIDAVQALTAVHRELVRMHLKLEETA